MRYKPHEVPLKFTLSFADFTLPVDFRFLLDMYDIRFHTRTSFFSFRKKKSFRIMRHQGRFASSYIPIPSHSILLPTSIS